MSPAKQSSTDDMAVRWRRVFGIGTSRRPKSANDSGLESAGLEAAGLESTSVEAQGPDDRITQAREAMMRIVRDRFGGDVGLLKQVQQISLSATEALEILQDAGTGGEPAGAQFDALEAVISFDGSRPSFLLSNDQIDFTSSYNTGNWRTDLAPFEDALAEHASCVCRVELGGIHIGTAFLVTPTLAITNRHVAQALARFSDGKIELKESCTVDFGRESGAGRKTYDPRRILDVVFAGRSEVAGAMDHARLDLAVLRLSESTLKGAPGKRHLAIGGVTAAQIVEGRRFLVAVGYPADPELYVPDQIWSEYGKVIRRLLEGEGGAKRLAPGQPIESLRDGLTEWTATHDATTINGNSGSPLLKFPVEKSPRAAGLHYGGRPGGDRVNWAHLLHYTATKDGYGKMGTFGDFCAKEGIDLS